MVGRWMSLWVGWARMSHLHAKCIEYDAVSNLIHSYLLLHCESVKRW